MASIPHITLSTPPPRGWEGGQEETPLAFTDPDGNRPVIVSKAIFSQNTLTIISYFLRLLTYQDMVDWKGYLNVCSPISFNDKESSLRRLSGSRRFRKGTQVSWLAFPINIYYMIFLYYKIKAHYREIGIGQEVTHNPVIIL